MHDVYMITKNAPRPLEQCA